MWGVIALNCEYHATKIHLSKQSPLVLPKHLLLLPRLRHRITHRPRPERGAPGESASPSGMLRSNLATRNGTTTPSYKKHSSIAPNP